MAHSGLTRVSVSRYAVLLMFSAAISAIRMIECKSQHWRHEKMPSRAAICCHLYERRLQRQRCGLNSRSCIFSILGPPKSGCGLNSGAASFRINTFLSKYTRHQQKKKVISFMSEISVMLGISASIPWCPVEPGELVWDRCLKSLLATLMSDTLSDILSDTLSLSLIHIWRCRRRG